VITDWQPPKNTKAPGMLSARGFGPACLPSSPQDDFKVCPSSPLISGFAGKFRFPKEVLNRESGFDPTVPNRGPTTSLGLWCSWEVAKSVITAVPSRTGTSKSLGPGLASLTSFYENLVFPAAVMAFRMEPHRNNFGSQNLFGFNSGAPLNARSSPTGFKEDPAAYWSTLKSASLPAAAARGVPAFTGTLPNRDPASANGQYKLTSSRELFRTALCPELECWIAVSIAA